MRYYDIMAPGDKLVQETANKNVLMALYPDDESPYTDFRRNEVIDAIGGAIGGGIFGYNPFGQK